MKTRCLPRVAACFLTAALSVAIAQTGSPAPSASASAPAASKSGPRLLTPAERRDNAAPQDDLRPQGAVLPQLSFPIGKSVPASAKKPTPVAARSDPAASGGINDEVARCEAQSDTSVRAKCREWLAQQGRGR